MSLSPAHSINVNQFAHTIHISVLCVQIIQLATVSQAPLSVINVKKPRFIHELTANDTSKSAKITKGDITHQHIA